jgi:hypothetical protein
MYTYICAAVSTKCPKKHTFSLFCFALKCALGFEVTVVSASIQPKNSPQRILRSFNIYNNPQSLFLKNFKASGQTSGFDSDNRSIGEVLLVGAWSKWR